MSISENSSIDSHGIAPGVKVTAPIWRVGTLSYTTAGLFGLFGWLLWGDFAWSVRERSVPFVIQLMLKKYDASDLLNGVLVGSVPAAVVVLVGPVVSYLSDRHRGPWGRRIPFLLAPTPVVVLSLLGVAFSPNLGRWLHHLLGGHSPGLQSSTLLCLGFFWTSFELAAIIVNSLFGALINDVVPEVVLGRFYSAFRAVILLTSIIFSYWGLGKAEVYYVWILSGVAAIYAVGITLMCWKVKEGGYPPLPDELSEKPGFLGATAAYFRESFGHSYYIWFFFAMAISWTAINPVNLFSVFFAKSLHIDISLYGKFLAVTYLVSLFIAYPIGLLVDRFHPLRITLVTLVLYAAVCFWGGQFVGTKEGFKIAFIAHGVVSGMFFTSTASLAQRLLPKTRFAQFASASGIITYLALTTVGPVAGLWLDHVHHAYQYTFFMGGILVSVGFLCFLVVHRKFMALGGPIHYRAPE